MDDDQQLFVITKRVKEASHFVRESVDMCEILMCRVSVCARDVVCAIVFGG